jgi:hypothetical protein
MYRSKESHVARGRSAHGHQLLGPSLADPVAAASLESRSTGDTAHESARNLAVFKIKVSRWILCQPFDWASKGEMAGRNTGSVN